MPQQVHARAEAAMLRISADLRTIQSQAFNAQDSIAKKIDDAFVSNKWTLYRRPFMEIAFTAGIAWVANNPKSALSNIVIKNLGSGNPGKAKSVEKATENLTSITKAITSVSTDPASTASSALIERLRTGQTELSNIHQSIISAITTHDQALQRLQGQEAASRQAG